MSNYELKAHARAEQGKGASRRLRRENMIPAIIYGGEGEPASIKLGQNIVQAALQDEGYYSQLINLNVDGQSEQVILRDMQRHPYKNIIQHMDFLRVQAGQEIQIHAPIHFINEEQCAGVKAGGTISHLEVEIHVSCLPKNLPEFIEIDVTNLGMGESLHISEIKLPEGVVSVDLAHGEDHDRALVSVIKLRGSSAEATEEGEE